MTDTAEKYGRIISDTPSANNNSNTDDSGNEKWLPHLYALSIFKR